MAAPLKPLPTPPIRLSESPRPPRIPTAAPFVPDFLPDAPRPTLPAWPTSPGPPAVATIRAAVGVLPVPKPLAPLEPAPIAVSSFPSARPAVPATSSATPAPVSGPTADFTDDDLREALVPLLGGLFPAAATRDADPLEPMLRATIRRALAEYSPASRPFKPPGAMDRLVWRMQALFTSRTYEDILFEKTRRFQVEEVFLLDSATLALVSFASCDPARHASTKRVEGTAQRLAIQLRDENRRIRPILTLPDKRRVVTCAGSHAVLAALVRGVPNAFLAADLEFALARIERRFREKFRQQGSPLLRVLQPYLEDCLLIQSPASAA
jgi:hypothetical protein